MKAMSKQELAERAGVTTKTLKAWCDEYDTTLKRMGLKPRAKVLQPHIVKFLAEKFCIDLE